MGAWGGVPSLGPLEVTFGGSPDAGLSLCGGPSVARGTRHGGGSYAGDLDGRMKKGASGGVPLCEGLH